MRHRRSSLLHAATIGLMFLGTTGGTDASPAREIDYGRPGSGRAPTYERASYEWPYASGPFYGRVDHSRRRDAGVLHTAVGSFEPGRGRLALPAELRTPNRLDRVDYQYFVIQFAPDVVDGDSLTSLRSTIESLGGAVVRRAPVSAWIARLTAPAFEALRGAPGLMAIEPYHAAFKIDPSIGRTPLPDPVKALSAQYTLDIRLFDGEAPDLVAKEIAALGANVLQVRRDTIRAEVHRSRLGDLAALQPVFMIFEHLPAYLESEETTTTIQTGRWNQGVTPFHDAGIDGGGADAGKTCIATGQACADNDDCGSAPDACVGQVLMVLDSGIQLDAADLSDSSVAPGSPGPEHRKVLYYGTTEAFGGDGDLLGCDGIQQHTHGHVVAATALGNATRVDASYGPPSSATDAFGRAWSLDGVAPGARLVALDAALTGATGCPLWVSDVGDLFSSPGVGSLPFAHDTHGARTVNFSWGSGDTYDNNAIDVDDFLDSYRQAMVFKSAGNSRSSYRPAPITEAGSGENGSAGDPCAITAPGTAKDLVVVGASRNASDPNPGPETRAFFTCVGPVPGNRIAPLLMAPGDDSTGTLGLPAEFVCQSRDNDQVGATLCDVTTEHGGTSYAAPAAAGAAMLFRDYLAQGFYPDATADNPGNDGQRILDVSGALVKAALVASAEFMGLGFDGVEQGDGLATGYRFNNEQGYGRIQLDNLLPLQGWSPSPSGLILFDGGQAEGAYDLGLPAMVDTVGGGTWEATFPVCGDAEELRVALAWVEPADPSGVLINDLDLRLIAPSGTTYLGNYFTDDNDRSGSLDPGEDCPGFSGATGMLDQGPWSLPVCPDSLPDVDNPIEAIFLSPDPLGDGSVNPIEIGEWRISIEAVAGGAGGRLDQTYAVVVTGGVCPGSTASLDAPTYTCSDEVEIVVRETDETEEDDASLLTPGEISERARVEVVAHDVCDDGTTVCLSDAPCQGIGGGQCNTDLVVDSESALIFDQHSVELVFSSIVALGSATARDPDNGLLDVRDGDTIRLVYADETFGSPDPDKERVSLARVDCGVRLAAGQITFPQYGRDTPYLVEGGCERNLRGQFELGYPDRYLDAGEALVYRFAFASLEDRELANVEAALRCVLVDADSPEGCADPSGCADPFRDNNPGCDGLLTILDSPRQVRLLPAGAALSVNFSLLMAEVIAGTPEIEMVLEVSAPTAGLSGRSVAVQRHRLDVDEVSLFYSTDYPGGGSQFRDVNNDERLENPTTHLVDDRLDYVFETRTWSDLTSGLDEAGFPVPVNTDLRSPWNFDGSDGGFTSGLSSLTTEEFVVETIAQWGEDKNFNNLLDGRCETDPAVACYRFPLDNRCPVANRTCEPLEDRDPENTFLDQNWSVYGGCGWQTRAPFTCTGDDGRSCTADEDCYGRCTVTSDPFVSTFTPCDGPSDCPDAGQCSPSSGNPLAPCEGDLDCMGGFCQPVPQSCAQDAGSCDFGSTQATGGVWHTGTIGETDRPTCLGVDSADPQCEMFEVLTGSSGAAQWVELLRTPVIEKVNRELDASGRPKYEVQILDWAWNQSIDLPDEHVAVSWTFDTDTARDAPVNLDDTFLAMLPGPYSPVDGTGVPGVTRGWSLFAPADPATYLSKNGTVGNDRQGKNACYFEESLSPAALAVGQASIGLAGPPDDDLNNGYCVVQPSTPCQVDADCPSGTCLFDDGNVDEYVTPSGPLRNMDLSALDGPDMRFNTLEDLYGDTGDTFQGAFGILNFEPEDLSENAEAGYGLAIDDVVVEWREFRLGDDAVSCGTVCSGDGLTPCDGDEDCSGNGFCGGGSCALVELETSNFYDGAARLEITVLEQHPSPNDCDHDGSREGTGSCSVGENTCSTNQDCVLGEFDTCTGADDFDCDDDGTPDVLVLATSDVEPAGEWVVLDRSGQSGGVHYTGGLDLSAAHDTPGTLFVQERGTDLPTVTIVYEDVDDGTGRPCRNHVDPLFHGRVEVATDLFLRSATVVVSGVSLSDNGDDDGWADATETVEMWIELSNKSGLDLTGVVAHLMTDDSDIDAVIEPIVDFGDLLADDTRASTQAFKFHVAEVERTDAFEDLSAHFTVVVTADQIDTLHRPQTIVLDLDLNVSGGGSPSDFVEDFEDVGLGSFIPLPLDLGLGEPFAADGYRCPYSDPGNRNSNVQGSTAAGFCHPDPDGGGDAFYFYQTTDRAFDGGKSLHAGIWLDAELGFTTPIGVLQAIVLENPVALSGDPAERPTLSFKHQASLMDWRTFDIATHESLDRAVVQVQLAASNGDPVGDWITIEPYHNLYDSQATAELASCMFDPLDDGNDEESFFDPDSPGRRLGPSSTCYPAYSFSNMGDTSGAFDLLNVGSASDGPGLQGATGSGTWVESAFNLERFRGRLIRVRFLYTSPSVAQADTYEQAYRLSPYAGDDGWFIDDVRISPVYGNPAVIDPDTAIYLPRLPGPGLPCTDPDSELTINEGALPIAPGEVIELTAEVTDGLCYDGPWKYELYKAGRIIEELSENRQWEIVPPGLATPDPFTYEVQVVCPGSPWCFDTSSVDVSVVCPVTSTIDLGVFGVEIHAATPSTFAWSGNLDLAWVRGDLGAVASYDYSSFETAVDQSSFVDTAVPASSSGFYYLVRPSGAYCNLQGSWQSSPGAEPQRDLVLP
ncbi:MAG: S8 family serine peptidase [bacterium]|nr:S8 family serine peptidase [bacterium]